MERKEELAKVFEKSNEKVKAIVFPLLEDVVYLEERLDYLRTLPSISCNPKNPAQQKATPSGKQYKEFLQQYTNLIKTLLSAIGEVESGEDSPLDAWLRKHNEE